MSKRTGKKAKDPNAPKRAMSAYIIFIGDYRKKTKDENPDLSFGEIAKLLGEKWKNIGEEEKKIFEEKAAKEKRRYEEEYQKYIQTKGAIDLSESDSEDERPKKRKKRVEKDPNAPKRPLSAFMLFSQKIRENVKKENPDAKFGETAKIIGQMWSDLSEELRAPYLAESEESKRKYQLAKVKYSEELGKSNQDEN